MQITLLWIIMRRGAQFKGLEGINTVHIASSHLALQSEIPVRVLGQCTQHVVKETDARVDVQHSAAVQVQSHLLTESLHR